MPFWVTFLWWLGTSIAAALINRPKVEDARPSGLDDFRVPTATEGRVVPVVVGKVRIGGVNALWYGDLRTVAIEDEVGGFLGIGAKDVTKGYRYFLGLQFALCRGPIEGHDRVWFADKVIKEGESTGDVVVQDLDFFGGEDQGGGIDFTLEFFNGAADQAVSSYLAGHQSPTPAYRRTAYMLLTDGEGGPGYIGDRSSMRDLAVEVYWYPNSLAVTGGAERIGDDANPICFLYELIVNNDDWGIVLDGQDVQVDGTAAQGALRAIAEDVADEGLGFSMMIDSQSQANELIQEIERHVDGRFRLDLTDGKYKIILARPPTGTPPKLDQSNIHELENFARGTWTETDNEVKIRYADRSKDYDETFAQDHDGANLDITGRKSSTTLRFPGVKNAALANLMASRELRGLSFPLAKLRAIVDRSLWTLQPGDPFDFDWPPYGITDMPCRVTRVRYGDDADGHITVDAVEDVFRIEQTGFSNPPDSFFDPPNFDAVAPLDARIWEPPAQLSAAAANPVLLVARDGGLHLEFDIYTDYDGGTGDFELSNSAVTNWTPVAELQGAAAADLDGPPHYEGSITIDNLNDMSFGRLEEIASPNVASANPANVLLIDDELMWFEDPTDNMDGSFTLTVHRGAFGTIPADHANDARVWFVGLGGVLVDADAAASLDTIRCRVVTKTSGGELDLGSTPNIPAGGDYTVAGIAPYAPGDVRINTNPLVDADWTRTGGLLEVRWKSRNQNDQDFDTKQDDASVASPGSVGYKVEIRRVDTDAIVASTSFATGGEFNAAGYIPQSSPGVADELDYYATVAAIQSGTESQVWTSQEFEVYGFGIDFGSDFGGLGRDRVLAQGDPPDIVEPIPVPEGQTRSYEIEVLGDPVAGDYYELSYRVFDAVEGEFLTVAPTLDGSSETTAAAMAQAIAQAFTAELADRPFNVSVSGRLVSITTTAGRVSFVSIETHIFTGSGPQIPRIATLQDPKAGSGGFNGTFFIDFYTQETQAGEVVTVLAPSSGAEYSNSGVHRCSVVLTPLTYAMRQEFESVFGATSVERDFSVSANPITPSRTSELHDLADEINASELGAYATASVGTYTGGEMTRSALTLFLALGVNSTEQHYELAPLDPTGFKLLRQENTPAIAPGPLGQVQQFRTVVDPLNYSFSGGEVVGIQINDDYFSATISAPGDPEDVNDAWASALSDLESALGSYSTELERGDISTYVTVTGPNNTTFYMLAWYSAGGSDLRITFEEV